MSEAPREPRHRRRWVTLLLVAIVFASGAAVGAGGATLVIARRIQHAARHPEQMPDRVVERLRGRLDLTREQAAQVRAILARRQATLASIRADARPRVRRELDAVRDEVAGVLDARQRARWDDLYDDLAARWATP